MSAVRPEPIPARQHRWLEIETAGWVSRGVIDAPQRAAILAGYRLDASAIERRGLTILTSLGVLAASIAVLLLIGYNWDAISRTAKVAIIFGVVAACFAASAIAYARGREVGGELLAFAGTLAYGNAIWLLAQVFHISSHYPDGALWWTIGALVAAHLLRSWLIGIEAAIVLAVWILMETGWSTSANFLFVPIALAAIAIAYRSRSSWTLAITALTIAFWIATGAGVGHDATRVIVALGALTGAAFYAAGLFHRDDSAFRNVWHGVGFAIIAIFLAPMLVREFQRPPAWESFVISWPSGVLAALLVAFTAFAAARRRGDGDSAVWTVATLVAGWLALSAVSPAWLRAPSLVWSLVVAFSAVTLFLGVSMIRAAMRSNRLKTFATGVGYVLLFLLVRWIDVLGSMLWSALFLLATAAALIALARLWRRRPEVTT